MTHRYAVVDIEATGPNIADGDKIIQIAAIIYENNLKVQQYEMLINPEIPIPPQISKLTGIYQKDVAKAPKLESVINLWHQRLQDCIFVGHNLAFDLRIMKEVFATNGLAFEPLAIDTFVLSKILYPTSPGYGLSDLAEAFEVELVDAHNALVDATFTVALVNNIAKEVQSLNAPCKEKLAVLAKYLPNDEILMFQQPEIFSNQETFSKVKSKENDALISNKEHLLGAYIMQEWQQAPYLIVEDVEFPLPTRLKTQVIKESVANRKTILAVQETSEMDAYFEILTKMSDKKIVTLKKADAYLNRDYVDAIQQKVHPDAFNQTELITWMVLVRFMSEPQNNDLTQINQEHQIDVLLSKLGKKFDLQIPKNKAYGKQLRRAKEADLVILSNHSLLYFVKENLIEAHFPFHQSVIFEDGQAFLNAGLA